MLAHPRIHDPQDPSPLKAAQDDARGRKRRTATLALTLALTLLLTLPGCIPTVTQRAERRATPNKYVTASADTTNSATMNWREFFGDPYLTALIDSALANNQELNIFMQEINISRNEIQARKGEYLPFVSGFAGADVTKTPRYTNIGAMEATTQIRPGRDTPDPLPNMGLGVNASWEIDIWRKLRNARDAAIQRYLGSMEGKNFLVTHLVAEIADAYYELLALDNQLTILQQNIDIQSNALEIVRLEKQSARVTELAVRRFEQKFSTPKASNSASSRRS
ncbi:MAG: TolC family protein [Bacteroidia bacterium]